MKAASFEMAAYQYMSRTSDAGGRYLHPVKEESSDLNNIWILRNSSDGFIAAIDKKTGRIING